MRGMIGIVADNFLTAKNFWAFPHGDFLDPVLPAEALRIHQLTVPRNEHDRAWQFAGVDRFLHGGVETAQTLQGQTDFFRTRLR